MLTDLQMDRVERMARLLLEEARRDSVRRRQEFKKFKLWEKAIRECWAAEEAVRQHPDDPARHERLLLARQVAREAGEALKR